MIQTLSPLSAAGLILSYLRTMGGKGSGNFGHRGRPGEIGGSSTVTVFHGTSERVLKAIKKEGLVAGKGKEFGADAAVGHAFQVLNSPRKASVFVTESKQNAAYFAEYAEESTGTKPVVLEIKIPKTEFSKFKLDEFSAAHKEWRREGYQIRPEWITRVADVKSMRKSEHDVGGYAIDEKSWRSLEMSPEGDLILYGVFFVDDVDEPETLGGPGSGNFDHKGRPGEVGGSSQSATARKKSERQQAIVKKLTSKYGFPEHKIIIKDMSNEKFTVNGREYETGGRYSHDTGEITVDSKTYSNRDFAGIVAHEITHDAFRQVDRSSNDTPEVKRFHDFLMNNRHELMDQDGVTKYSTAYWGKVAGPEGSENYKRALNETLAEVSFLKEAFHGGDTPPAWSVKPVWTDLHTRLFDAYRAINSGIAEKSPIFQKVKGR